MTATHSPLLGEVLPKANIGNMHLDSSYKMYHVYKVKKFAKCIMLTKFRKISKICHVNTKFLIVVAVQPCGINSF